MRISLAFLLAFVGGMVFAAPHPGVVTAGRGTPVIDGRLDEAAWSGAIALKPFLLQKAGRPAAEETELRILWDDEALYFGFRCHERALNPVDNRLHAFKRACTTHDSDALYKDDSVEVLLVNPRQPKRVYDLIVGASGAFKDSVASRTEAMWVKREPAWESGAKVAVVVTEGAAGAWTAEFAIPWKSLGGRSDGAWLFKAARFEKPSRENSAWQPIAVGIHLPGEFSELRLADSVPGVALEAWPEFVPGENTMAFRCAGGIATSVEATVAFSGAAPSHFRSFMSGAGAGRLPFQLEGRGNFTFHWSVEGTADFADIFRSPDYSLAASAQLLEAELKGARLVVNGRPAGKTAVLRSGLNELRLSGAAAGVRLQADGFPVDFPDGWRTEKDGTRTLKLACGISSVWPNWQEQGLWVNRGGIQQLLLAPHGIPGHAVSDYGWTVELPAGMKLLGASGYYDRYPLETTALTGNRWRVTVKRSLKWREALQGHEYIALVLGIDEKAPGHGGQLHFWATSASACVREVPQTIEVHYLPPAHGGHPRKFLVQLWCGWLAKLDRRDLFPLYLDYMCGAGTTQVPFLPGAPHEVPSFFCINFKTWNLNLSEYAAAHPARQRVTFAGKADPTMVCPHEMLAQGDFRAELKRLLPVWHAAHGRCQEIQWDFEHGVFGDSPISCYCPRCLADFAKAAKLPAPPKPADLQKLHGTAWIEFMTQRQADIAGLLRDAIHEALPAGTVFSIYSGYECEDTHRVYGVDWRKLDGRIDRASMGYGRNPANLEATYAALEKTPLVLGAIIHPYRFTERFPPRAFTAAQLMRRACDATAGILLYYYPTADGRSFSALAKATTLIAAHEECFLNRRNEVAKLQLQGGGEAEAALLSDDRGRQLIVLMNGGTAPRTITCGLPGAGGFTDAFTGKAAPNPVTMKLAPGDIAAFTVAP